MILVCLPKISNKTETLFSGVIVSIDPIMDEKGPFRIRTFFPISSGGFLSKIPSPLHLDLRDVINDFGTI